MADYRRPQYNRQSYCGQQEVMRQASQQTQQTAAAAGASCSMSRASDDKSTEKSYDMDRFPIAMLYVPWQRWNQTYELDRGLKTGTIFPDLDRPFRGVRKGGCKK